VIRRIFKWLTLARFGYVAAGCFAQPDVGEVLRGTFVPAVRLDGPFLAPRLLCLIVLIANSRAIMGERVNGRRLNALGCTATVAMGAAAVGLVPTWGRGSRVPFPRGSGMGSLWPLVGAAGRVALVPRLLTGAG
jgi:hypothetical protein